MARVFPMPQLGSTMEEGLIVRWLKQEGESVAKGETLLEIETDKATMTVEAEEAGVLRQILHPADSTVAVHTPVAILGDANESIDGLLAELGLAVPVKSDNASVFISPRARRMAEEKGIAVADLAGRGTGPDGRVLERDVAVLVEARSLTDTPSKPKATPRATPLAARIADEQGIDLSELATGLPGSRVRREDVERHIEHHSESHSEERSITNAAASRLVVETAATTPALPETFTVVGFHGMRKRIADNVAKSAFTAPHVTLTLEVDMTEATAFRARLLPDVEKAYGARLSFTDLLVKAAARALRDFPLLNATLVGDEIRLHRHCNIGVAVALDEGLIVPVLKHAETKTLGIIAAERAPLVERARAGTLTPDDLSGGTFTITNLGAFGIDLFDPIIVSGQAAILGVGRIADKPVVVNNEVVIRAMMNLCLSFDHRILDGAPASRFLQRLKELLETPLLILV